MTSPERVWSWSFNDWQEGWGGYARKEHLAPICEKERDTGSEYVRIDLFKSQQAKLAKAMETLEQITTIICSAVQGDNEHGVRSLNEIAAKNYLKDFPLTLAAITEVQDVIDAALAELEGMNE
jgi:hypothetical protein